jgi:Sec-independent protein translocase protein TatA
MNLPEMFFLAILGLVIFGPRKLMSAGQEAGKALTKLKKISGDFQWQPQEETRSRKVEPGSLTATKAGDDTCNFESNFSESLDSGMKP